MKELEKEFDKKFGKIPQVFVDREEIKSFYRSAIKKMIRECLPKELNKSAIESIIGFNLCRSQFLKNLKDKYGIEI